MLNSLLDTDLYKLTMQQAVLQRYPTVEARYRFIDRGGVTFPPGFALRVRRAVQELATLRLTATEIDWLRSIQFLGSDYIDRLSHYRFDPQECLITRRDGQLDLTIQGPWWRTILWEVPLMAIISELWFSDAIPYPRATRRQRNRDKAQRLQRIQFADFGTRRRFSAANQQEVLEDLLSIASPSCIGTSNVHLARLLGLHAIGTHAHEWFMQHGATVGYTRANAAALDAWFDVYGGALGIALTDTYTVDMFLRCFSAERAARFAGVRHDSGDPFVFADRIIRHYQDLQIDPLTKTIVFSDGLNPERAIAIDQHCRDRIQTSFGIGTDLTNDVGVHPLNMVIKMVACRESSAAQWRPTVKLSDEPGKHTGDPAEIQRCLRCCEACR